jgi:hypothetical protein
MKEKEFILESGRSPIDGGNQQNGISIDPTLKWFSPRLRAATKTTTTATTATTTATATTVFSATLSNKHKSWTSATSVTTF